LFEARSFGCLNLKSTTIKKLKQQTIEIKKDRGEGREKGDTGC